LTASNGNFDHHQELKAFPALNTDPRVDLLHTRQNRRALRKWYIPYLSRSCLLELKNALLRAKEILNQTSWSFSFYFTLDFAFKSLLGNCNYAMSYLLCFCNARED
jgi:hypothetical protein